MRYSSVLKVRWDMKRINLLVATLGIFGLLMANSAEAKRLAPKEVEPVVYNGVKYIAPHWGYEYGWKQNGGYIQAWDIKTGKKLWEKRVYEIKYDPWLEKDVQDVFITSLSIEDGKLVVINEEGRKYKIAIPKKILKEQLASSDDTQQIRVGIAYSEAIQILQKVNAKETALSTALPEVMAEKKKLYAYEIYDGRIIQICVNKLDQIISGLSVFEYPIEPNSIGRLKSVEYVDILKSPKAFPWSNKAPNPYENKDKTLVANSYKEDWAESSIEKHHEAVQKAQRVLSQWGQNAVRYEYKGNLYTYKISVSESPNFISVVFYPVSLAAGSERHVEIRMTKKDYVILSILPGS
jgi:hypothetical protein